jgi:hypothetical protein
MARRFEDGKTRGDGFAGFLSFTALLRGKQKNILSVQVISNICRRQRQTAGGVFSFFTMWHIFAHY